MRIIHEFQNNSIEKEVSDPFLSFLLSDRCGSYFSQGILRNISFFQGLICRYPIKESNEWEMFKFLERISSGNEDKIVSLRKHQKGFDIIYQNHTEKYSMDYENSINVKTDSQDDFYINIDPKKLYDFDNLGRIIKYYEEENVLIFEYTKLDEKTSQEQYKLFLGIKNFDYYEIRDQWIKRIYDYDGAREGVRKEWYVNEGVKVKPLNGNLIISQHYNKKKLIDILNNRMKQEDVQNLNPLLKKTQLNKDLHITYCSAINAIDELIIRNEGIYAGYYWFFHFWSRDEAISLGGLISEQNKKPVKKFINKQLSNILVDGRIPNRFPSSKLGSADGVGWAIKRLKDSWDFFSSTQKKSLIKKLEKIYVRLLKNHTKDSLAINDNKETWMDTTGTFPDMRNGARIEVQALRLSFYKFLFDVTQNDKYKKEHDRLKDQVRAMFFVDGNLCDGLVYDKENKKWFKDKTIRPNIFLAYYVYPDFLSSQEWEQVIDYSLPSLWLEWGGLSTIEYNHEWFQNNYSGTNDKSYHRGDSWFFVNNIAAISMRRINKHKYEKYVDKILDASKEDLLFKGIMGGASEVSSASELRAEGTWHQAWSAATLIELIHEISKNH